MTALENKIQAKNFLDALMLNARENSVILMSREGTIIDTNEAFLNVFGYKKEEIKGHHSSILFTAEDLARGLLDNELAKVLATAQASDNNYLVKKDRTLLWAAGESTLVKDEEGNDIICKIIQNIQDFKITENSLAELHEFNENILATISDVVYVIDNELNLIKANKAFYDVITEFDVDPTNTNLRTMMSGVKNDQGIMEKLEQAVKGNGVLYNKGMEIETRFGDMKYFEVSCIPMKGSGGKHFLVIIHDITSFKHVEREREDIIGFVAHELRNPLSNIVLCNELMKEALEEKDFAEVADLLSRSNNNVTRLNNMIAELYDATKINSGKLLIRKTRCNLEEILKEAVQTISSMQPKYNIVVEGPTDIIVEVDKDRIIQVITNYLSNGIKYSNGNPDVIIRVAKTPQDVTISVTDRGLGIAKQFLPKMFKRFFRAEKTKNIEGLGLGLFLCKQIVTAHHGKVWAESQEEKGSTFYFSIPLTTEA